MDDERGVPGSRLKTYTDKQITNAMARSSDEDCPLTIAG